MEKEKILVIVGPTASGKSDLAVSLAKKFNGEIISADSRQVYKGFNITSGKVTKKEMAGVKHYLIDVASPKRDFGVTRFVKESQNALKEITKKGKLPIIAGGTGHYINALVYDQKFPSVPPNTTLRKKLEKESTEKLAKMLFRLDRSRYLNIDKKNKRKLIRAIEISKTLGKVPKVKSSTPYNSLWLGIKVNIETLKKNIGQRLDRRIKAGMIKEVLNLHEKERISWKRLKRFGLEYKYVSYYLEGKISREEMIEKLNTEILRYAKRQMKWFKRNSEIHWLSNTGKSEKLVRNFLKK